MPRLLVVFLLSFLCSVFAGAQPTQLCTASSALTTIAQRYHVHPADLDRSASSQIFDRFIARLDPDRMYFTAADTATLGAWRYDLCDVVRYSKKQLCVFTEETAKLYERKLRMADSMSTAMLSVKPDFTGKDTLTFLPNTAPLKLPADMNALQKRWSRWMRYLELSWMLLPLDSTDDPMKLDEKKLLLREPDIREKLKRRVHGQIGRVLNVDGGLENYVAETFLNAVALQYDPHSEFFSPKVKSDFESGLSTQLLSFGVLFDDSKSGGIEVVQLTPGGAAWKTNRIHRDDVLLSLKWPEEKTPVDISVLFASEINELLMAAGHDSVELSLRGSDGREKDIVLHKEKIRNDENTVKGYLLSGTKKIGYIALPSFYEGWESNVPLGCANDVAKELTRLQEEKIDGLILDLRYNGGGAVNEAMNLAGLFVDEGPLFLSKAREGKPMLVKDPNRGTAYSGPLMVLVNGQSASASELFCSAMQDYHRAIIVGDTTFGKASGQIMLPLDTGYHPEMPWLNKPPRTDVPGYLKLTTERFYRLDKSTYQAKGIVPDVLLPDPFYQKNISEATMERALPNDSVVKNVVFQPLPALPVADLRAKSHARVAASPEYKHWNALNDSIAQYLQRERPFPLRPEAFRKAWQQENALYEHFADLHGKPDYKAENTASSATVIAFDEYEKTLNAELLKALQDDLELTEAYSVLLDYLTLSNH